MTYSTIVEFCAKFFPLRIHFIDAPCVTKILSTLFSLAEHVNGSITKIHQILYQIQIINFWHTHIAIVGDILFIHCINKPLMSLIISFSTWIIRDC